MTIKRIWHGWTTPENADSYQSVVRTIVEPGIAAMGISGYGGLELLRKVQSQGEDGNEEVEFVTIMIFDCLETIIEFQGENYTKAHVPEAAQKFLKRWDSHAEHFEVQD